MKIGIIASAFDLLHPGHLLILEEAKRYCDHLICALHTDPTIDRPEKNRPIQTTYERTMQLTACKWVDQIIAYDTENDLQNMLLSRHIDIRFLGDDYKGKKFTGDNITSIKIHFHERNHNFSSTELRQRILNDANNRNNVSLVERLRD